MAKLISKTYGEALFELAVEENKTKLFLEEVTGLLGVIKENRELGQFMNHPKIPKEEKIQSIKNIFRGRIDQDLLGFLITVIEKDRYVEIEAILEYVIVRIKEYLSIGTAYVTTAVPLEADEKKQIEERLLATTGYQTIESIYQVDASLIGGVIIRMGDRVVDSSIRTKMEKMERELLAIQV